MYKHTKFIYLCQYKLSLHQSNNDFRYHSAFFKLLFNGKLKPNVAPLPLVLFAAHISPPCDSIIFLDRYNPKPIPFSDVVVNFSKSLSLIVGSIPLPVSCILTTTAAAAALLLCLLFLRSSISTIMVPSSVNFIELFNRLEITWVILSLSPYTL